AQDGHDGQPEGRVLGRLRPDPRDRRLDGELERREDEHGRLRERYRPGPAVARLHEGSTRGYARDRLASAGQRRERDRGLGARRVRWVRLWTGSIGALALLLDRVVH